MRVLLVSSAFNSLTQRVHAELREDGHIVSVHLAVGSDDLLRDAVARFEPQLIIAPMLTRAIPRDVWSSHTVLIVHPGPIGDQGPSSLDWAILNGRTQWGVTVLQAVEEMDAGDVWASVPFTVAACGKSELYRTEAADAASEAVRLAVARYQNGSFTPKPVAPDRRHARPFLRQEARRIDWTVDSSEVVVRKLRAGDSQPGVLDELFGDEYFLHGGHPEDELRGPAGAVLATRDGAICRATTDGAVWIPRLRRRRLPDGTAGFKLPATDVLGAALAGIPEVAVTPAAAAVRETWSQIRYRQQGRVGFLEFSFPDGAMSTEQCRQLLDAYKDACRRPTRVLVLGPERDFFSNGIHLHVIEGAQDPAAESWANINAMDDLVQEILHTTDRIIVSALAGNAAAGGLMLSLAADQVWCRGSAVLNPHYRLMGLYGSEFWTYTLPRRVGKEAARRLTTAALPVGAQEALGIGLVDRVITGNPRNFRAIVAREAIHLAAQPQWNDLITAKQLQIRLHGPEMENHRKYELARMQDNFFDPTQPYHALRRDFVRKVRPAGPPEYLAEPAGPVDLFSVNAAMST